MPNETELQLILQLLQIPISTLALVLVAWLMVRSQARENKNDELQQSLVKLQADNQKIQQTLIERNQELQDRHEAINAANREFLQHLTTQVAADRTAFRETVQSHASALNGITAIVQQQPQAYADALGTYRAEVGQHMQARLDSSLQPVLTTLETVAANVKVAVEGFTESSANHKELASQVIVKVDELGALIRELDRKCSAPIARNAALALTAPEALVKTETPPTVLKSPAASPSAEGS